MNNMQEYCDIANKTKFCMVEINNVYQAAHVIIYHLNHECRYLDILLIEGRPPFCAMSSAHIANVAS